MLNKILLTIKFDYLWKFTNLFYNFFNNKKSSFKFKNIRYTFSTPSRISKFRALTFASKEPDTLSWIDSFESGSCFWDIGGNVGLYSIYAAKTRNVKCFTFEPSVLNLNLLAKNISLNNVSRNITIVPIALSNKSYISNFNILLDEPGSALSSFGDPIDQDGSPYSPSIKYNLFGSSGDDLISFYSLKPPDYLKLDVDGLEPEILDGLSTNLAGIKSLLVEVNDDLEEMKKKCSLTLKRSGFELISRSKLQKDNNQYNEIWVNRVI